MRTLYVYFLACLLVPAQSSPAERPATPDRPTRETFAQPALPGRPTAESANRSMAADRTAAEAKRLSAAASEAVLGRLLIGLLEEDAFERIQHDHPLRPVAEVPSIATLSYLLFGEDPQLLAQLYPRLSRIVSVIFSPQQTTATGLIAGERLGGGRIAHPGLNAMAALELHSLSLIAAAAGYCQDAIELRDWSYRHADIVRRLFYDPEIGTFHTLAGSDPFRPVYLPEQLLPFLVGRRTGTRALCAAAERIREQERPRRTRPQGAALWDDPALRPMIVSLLFGTEGSACEDLADVLADAFPEGAPGSDPSAHTEWIAFWSSATDAPRRLRPPADDLFILRQMAVMFDRSGLLALERRAPFAADLDFLVKCLELESETVDLDRHIAAMEAAERLHANVSEMADALETGKQMWKIFDERLWNRMSLRERRIATEACRLAPLDLAAARQTVSARMMRTTGIVAALRPPERPVHAGEQVALEITLSGARIPLAIELVSLRAAGKRWLLDGADETLALGAESAPLRWTRRLPSAPYSDPGLYILEACLEFVAGVRRVEIHLVESFALAPKYDVALHFPRGRTIRDEAIPVEVVLKHPPGERIYGTLSGLFTGDFACEPLLPADFFIGAETEITILPLKISAGAEAVPGRHPFTLSVILGDARVAVFDETLVRPMRWLHLGPLPGGGWLAGNAADLATDLAAAHDLPGGGSVRWLEVPAAAFDAAGAVRPERLYGPQGQGGMLLYAAVMSPRQSSVRWHIGGDCPLSLWINDLPLDAGGSADPSSVLSAGRNSILVASDWNEPCAAILLEILDEGGLPVAQLYDATGAAVRDAALSLATSPDALPHPEQPREVTFILAHPEAREVSLIGEFNGWAPEAAQMLPLGEGLWKASVFLTPGTYSYKFLVDRRQRIVDPQAQTIEPDGFGGYNAVVTVK